MTSNISHNKGDFLRQLLSEHPELLAEEKAFACDFFEEHGELPMFFLVGRTLQHSFVRNAQLYAKTVGIDGSHPITMDILAKQYKMSESNVRQQISGRTFFFDRSFETFRHSSLWEQYDFLKNDSIIEGDGVFERMREREHLPYGFMAFSLLCLLHGEFKMFCVSTEGKILPISASQKCISEHKPFFIYSIGKEMQDFHFAGTLPEMNRLYIKKGLPKEAVSMRTYFINYNRFWYKNRSRDLDYCERVQRILERIRDDIYGHLWM